MLCPLITTPNIFPLLLTLSTCLFSINSLNRCKKYVINLLNYINSTSQLSQLMHNFLKQSPKTLMLAMLLVKEITDTSILVGIRYKL